MKKIIHFKQNVIPVKKKYFIVIGFAHLLLVITDMLIYHYNQYEGGDAQRYLFIANEFTSFNFFHPVANFATCITPPGYPIFLAIIKIITQHNQFLIAIIQSLLYCISLYYLLFNLLKKGYLNYSLCIVSYFLVLFSPEIFQTNQQTATEPFCGILILLITGSIINGFDKNITKVLYIISTCLLVLARFEYLSTLPILILPLIYNKKYKLTLLTIFSLILVFTSNGVKNYITFDDFNPLDYNSGAVIYGGNNLNGDGTWHNEFKNTNYLPANKREEYRSLYGLDPKCCCIKQDSFFKAMAFNAWKDNWRFQLKIIPYKFLKLWVIPASMDFYCSQTEYKKGLQIKLLFSSKLWPWYGKYKHGFYLFVYWAYLLLVISGFYFKIKEYGFNYNELFVVVFFLIISFLYSVPFTGIGRFHVPIFGLLVLYSSFGIKYLDRFFFNSKLFIMLDKL